jgi:hypothetical protein
LEASARKARRLPVLLAPVLVSFLAAVGSVPAGATPAGDAPNHYPRLTTKLEAAFNSEYRELYLGSASGLVPDRIELGTLQGNPRVSLQKAVSLVNHECTEGEAVILGVGVVEAAFASGRQWAVSYNPPGRHQLAEAAATTGRASRDIGNWFLGFVGTRRAGRPFCTAGCYAGLPPLPVHGS